MVVNSARAASISWIISKLGSKADRLGLPSNNINVCGRINTFIERHVNVVEPGRVHTMKRRAAVLHIQSVCSKHEENGGVLCWVRESVLPPTRPLISAGPRAPPTRTPLCFSMSSSLCPGRSSPCSYQDQCSHHHLLLCSFSVLS